MDSESLRNGPPGRVELPPAEEPDAPAGMGTILVIEDESVVRDVVRNMLEKFGYRVLTAADGLTGVETFRAYAGSIALVLLDVTMPALDGEEALREIRRIRPDARVILTSGYTEQDVAGRFAGSEPEAFLQKPYGPMTLFDKVERMLRG
jgi:two-component system, cell cycle sensor histidine kinase and response regulator CckA